MSLTSLVQGPIFLFLKGNDRNLNSHKTLLVQQQYCISFHVTIVTANSGTFLFPDSFFLFVDIRFIGQSEGGSKRAGGPKIEN